MASGKNVYAAILAVASLLNIHAQTPPTAFVLFFLFPFRERRSKPCGGCGRSTRGGGASSGSFPPLRPGSTTGEQSRAGASSVAAVFVQLDVILERVEVIALEAWQLMNPLGRGGERLHEFPFFFSPFPPSTEQVWTLFINLTYQVECSPPVGFHDSCLFISRTCAGRNPDGFSLHGLCSQQRRRKNEEQKLIN